MHGTKELFNLPPLVLKAIGTSLALPFAGLYIGACARVDTGMVSPIGLGLVVEDEPSELS